MNTTNTNSQRALARASRLFLMVPLGLSLAFGSSGAAEETAKSPAPGDGLNVVHVGNSHSHPLRLLVPLAKQAGHDNFKEGHINILGASLGWNWDHGAQNKWPETLAATNRWDAITLLSWGNEDEKYAPLFMGEALKGNPKCQAFIYVIWPNADMDFEKPPEIRSEEHGEKVADAVAKAFPQASPPRVIPASLLIRELGRLADRGELPHVDSRFALYCDGGHLSSFGAYAVNVMICAMLYNESPMAYPADIYSVDERGQPNRKGHTVTVPPETAEVIKRTAWDILQTYPRAGMPPQLVIGNRRLDLVIAGQPFKATLQPLNAAGPCAWSIASGTLPAGISLSKEGVLAGRSSAIGNYPVTIRLTDGKKQFERPFVLSVAQDTPPVIPAQPLEKVTLDQYVFHPLKAEGGVGHLTWSMSGGALPHGLLLTSAGIVVGSPGESGTFTFKTKVEDSFTGGARSAEKEFAWVIGPATPATLQAKSVVVSGKPDDPTVVIDGHLDKPYWNLDQQIAKKVKGAPEKKASFGAIWTHLNNKPDGRELVLAFKVLDGPKGKTPKDGIHIFIDGNHDQKVIYGADDTHFFVPRVPRNSPKGWEKAGWADSIRGKPNWFTAACVQEIDGGYTMEVRLGGGNYFQGEGNWLRFGAKGVYGLDVAVDEGDGNEIAQQVWRGDANDAEDTSHFGTIVLINEPAK